VTKQRLPVRSAECELAAFALSPLEVTQLPRERWHPAGSGSTELAERPPEMAVIATA